MKTVGYTVILSFLFTTSFVAAQTHNIKAEETYFIPLINLMDVNQAFYDQSTQELVLCGKTHLPKEEQKNLRSLYFPMVASVNLSKLSSCSRTENLWKEALGEGYFKSWYIADDNYGEVGFDQLTDFGNGRYGLGTGAVTIVDQNTFKGNHQNKYFRFNSAYEYFGFFKISDTRYVAAFINSSDKSLYFNMANEAFNAFDAHGSAYGVWTYGNSVGNKMHICPYPDKNGYHYLLLTSRTGYSNAYVDLMKLKFSPSGLTSEPVVSGTRIEITPDIKENTSIYHEHELPQHMDISSPYNALCYSQEAKKGKVYWNRNGNLVWIFYSDLTSDGTIFSAMEISPDGKLVKYKHISIEDKGFDNTYTIKSFDDNHAMIICNKAIHNPGGYQLRKEAMEVEVILVDLTTLQETKRVTSTYSAEESLKDLGFYQYEVLSMTSIGVFKGPSGKWYTGSVNFYKSSNFAQDYAKGLVLAEFKGL